MKIFLGTNFPGHRFSWTQIRGQIHIQTQIRLNRLLTLATKHLMIIKKDNLYLHLKVLNFLWVAIFPLLTN